VGIVNKRPLTDREKAAIYLHVFGNVTDWIKIYVTAFDGTTEQAAEQGSLRALVSRWKTSEKVQKFLKEAQELKAREAIRHQDEGRQAGRVEAEREAIQAEREGKPAKAAGIDYTDPSAQKRKLNQIIRDAQTTGEALDALKIIISTQKDDRQAARDLSQVRAFLPLRCELCPLYAAARAKMRPAEG